MIVYILILTITLPNLSKTEVAAVFASASTCIDKATLFKEEFQAVALKKGLNPNSLSAECVKQEVREEVHK